MSENFYSRPVLKGGPMMWPLLICSLISLVVTIDRLLSYMRLPSEEEAEAQLTEVESVLENGGEAAVEHFKQNKGVLNFVFAALLKRYDSLVLENRTDLEDMRQELITVTEEAGIDYLGRLLNALGTLVFLHLSWGYWERLLV